MNNELSEELDEENIKAYYYQERINLAKERISKKKDFLPVKELLKELQTQSKDSPLSSKIKEKILRAFPELSLLEYQRFEHVFSVIEYFHKLVSENFNYFVNTLPMNEKEKTSNETFNDYITNLKILHNIYKSLKEEEKEILWLITVLHDIGDIGEHAEHCEIGAELIELVLARSDYSLDDINLAINVVKYHIYPGMVAQGERTPRSLIKAIESISQKKEFQDKFSKFLIIFHTMDLAGWRAGKNSLTPDRLERRMGYLNKKRLEDLTKDFWRYRLEQLSKEDFDAPIKQEYVEKIWGQINQLLSQEETNFFEKHLNETIDLEDCMPIIQSLSRIGKSSSTESAKNFIKMFRFFAQFAELYRADYTLISSNHYPLEKEYKFILDYINKCLRKVPDKMSKDKLKEHLEKNAMNSFFDIPIKVKDYKLIFDIDILIEKRKI